MRLRALPRDDRFCGWYAILPPPGPALTLAGEQNADWVVVGAGFTGLAAARRLAELHPEARVVLLEAQRVGFGASGRNSGFVVDVPHYEEALGLEGNRRMLRLARAGIASLGESVRKHGIDCAWAERGLLHGTVGDVGMAGLDGLCRGLDEMEELYERLDAPAVAAITGSSHYRAAVRLPGTVSVQPAALIRGLAGALPASVELFEDSPVEALHVGETIRLECAGGAVRTPRLLLATNGFTPSLGFLRRRLFPMLTYASLTRRLRDDERAALGGESEWGLVPEERMGTSVRRTRDDRILIRNTVRYESRIGSGAVPPRRIRALHRDSFEARFPALHDVGFEYTWGGVMGVSLNNAQFFGGVAPGVYASAGYNGVGIALGTASGELLADLASGAESPLLRDIQALPGPAWVPPDPFLGIGARWTLRRRQRRAGVER